MRPIQHLPVDFPANFDPSEKQPDFFYENFAKHFTKDMIKMTSKGLNINETAVEDLRKVIHNVLAGVDETLKNNKLIKQYQKHVYPQLVAEYKEKVLAAVRTKDYYLKEYNNKNMLHRTYAVNQYLIFTEKQSKIKDKWTIACVKKLNIFLQSNFLDNVAKNTLNVKNNHAVNGMLQLAEDQAVLWNKPRYDKSHLPVEVPAFNPGSAKQMQQFFDMMKIEPISVSAKTNKASWDRDNVEVLYKSTTDENLLEVLQAFVDHSFSGIIRNNFLAAFDNFTIDGVLHGNIKVFGAKSFRPTSNAPNLLNMPSTKSIYAKPLKACFVSSPGRVIYTIDLSALEDRGIANLSGDTNKQNIFLENLDGHSLNACGYFREEVAKTLGPNTDNVAYVKEFFRLVEEKHPELSMIRFNSKAPTFKLAYGGYPDSHKNGVITQEIFDNYHNVLYPGITDYRENYVLPFAKKHGYIHLGLGCRLYTSDAENHIRTINNATVQFWSILTLIAVNELNYRIEQAGYQDSMDVISTIYDSVYVDVDNDPKIIKWLNDNLVECMCVQWLKEEVVRNEAEGEIGLNFANLHRVVNNASVKDITKVLETVYGNQ